MSLVYDFIFTAADYSGTTATIYGPGGTEIEQSPVTLDATGRFSLSLPEGIYRAITSNPNLGLGNASTDGVLNLAASIAAGGGGGALPVLFVANGNEVVPFSGSPASQWATQTDFVGTAGLIEIDDADPTTFNVLTTGDYLITLFAQAKLDINTTVDTPGTASVTSAVSVNGENAGPAWDFYPAAPTYLAEAGQYFPAVCLPFPQHLTTGDTVQAIHGGALGTAVLTDGGYSITGNSYMSFAKIG